MLSGEKGLCVSLPDTDNEELERRDGSRRKKSLVTSIFF